MASYRWKGRAALVARVSTVQITAYDAATTYKLTRNLKVVSCIAAGSVNATATALAAAWEASDEPEFTEITASAATDTVTLTNDTEGVDWGTITPSVSGGTGTIGSLTSVTANSGPSDVGIAANYDGNAVPAGSDTLKLDNSEVPLLYSLDQSGAGTLTLLQIDQSFTADVGLPEVNESGTAEYLEDRQRYYKIRASSVIVGRGPGSGSGRILLDQDSVQTAVVIEGTGSPSDADLEACLWKGTHASNAMTVKGSSSVGIAVYGGEVATLLTLTVMDDATVRVGAGVTLGTVTVYGGTVDIYCAVATAIVMYGGTVRVHGTGAVALAQVYGGTLVYSTTGTLGGACLVGENGLIDFSQDPRAKTVTNAIDVYGPNCVNDPDKVVATLVIDWNGTTPLESLGTNIRLTRGATA